MSPRVLPPGRLLPLIIATGLFMENLDSTVLSTALPTIAHDFGASPIHLKLALTSYLLSLAIFIPASGWMADRFGARTVFRAAIVVFAAGSIACGLSTAWPNSSLARVVQGMGGAMMTPVGRLIILKTTPKRDLVDAMAWLTIPALLGPLMGPPVGGFITTFFSLALDLLDQRADRGASASSSTTPLRAERARGRAPAASTSLGFLLVGPGLATLLTGATLAGIGLVRPSTTLALAAGRSHPRWRSMSAMRCASQTPLIELRLLRFPVLPRGDDRRLPVPRSESARRPSSCP